MGHNLRRPCAPRGAREGRAGAGSDPDARGAWGPRTSDDGRRPRMVLLRRVVQRASSPTASHIGLLVTGADILLSSARQDWQTPEWFLDLVRSVGPIALDPCTTVLNPSGALKYITQEPGSCGLSCDWSRGSGLAFINPPYGRHLSGPVDPGKEIRVNGDLVGTGTGWAERIAQDKGEWIALVPTRTDATWWHTLLHASEACLLWRSPTRGSRIQFVDPSTGKPRGGSTLASSVFYCGMRQWRFEEVFEEHGAMIEEVPR